VGKSQVQPLLYQLALAFLLLPVFPSSGISGEIKKLKLERTAENFYLIEVEVQVEASEQKVATLLTDYGYLTRLNSQILESELINVDESGVSQVRTKIRPCGYLLCQTIHQVQKLRRSESGSIVATVIPEKSDFLEGHAKWDFQSQGTSVTIHFQARLLPRFWVPPFINLWVMRRMLENEMLETITNLEELQLR